MKTLRLYDFVRLTHDLPDRNLRRNDVGVVVNVRFSPTTLYEVDLHQDGRNWAAQCVLEGREIELVGEPMLDVDGDSTSKMT